MNLLHKIAVIGDTGAGKTTFALSLAQRFNLPYYSSDSYRFTNGIKRPDSDFLDDVRKIVSQGTWVFDSAHTISGPIVWPRADVVIYLKFSIRILLYRVLKRALRRLLTGERYDDGRKENVAHLFGKDGWITTFYPRLREKREKYEYYFNQIGKDTIPLIVLSNPHEAKRYLEELK